MPRVVGTWVRATCLIGALCESLLNMVSVLRGALLRASACVKEKDQATTKQDESSSIPSRKNEHDDGSLGQRWQIH